MDQNESIQLFEDRRIRTAWDETNEEWYFSVVDVVGVLTDSPDYNTGKKYWNKLKQRPRTSHNRYVPRPLRKTVRWQSAADRSPVTHAES